jgi:hypothetical protein
MPRALAIGCFALAAFAQPVSAEWHFTPMVGLTFHPQTNTIVLAAEPIKTHKDVGGSVALLGKGIFGVEGVGVFTPSFKSSQGVLPIETSRTVALMGNAVLTTPRRWTEYSLRPFLSGGFGLMRLSLASTENVLPVRSNRPGFDIGGGAVGFLSKHTGLRFDLRYYSTLRRPNQELITQDQGRLSYLTLSAGVVFRR